jgi:hypothetical protein
MASRTSMKKSPPRPPHWFDGADGNSWHTAAPRDVVKAYSGTKGRDGWGALSDYLETRCDRTAFSKLLPAGDMALLLMMPEVLVGTETAELVGQLGRCKLFDKPRKRRRWSDAAAGWLDAASVASASVAHAYECLAWAHAIPRLSRCLGEDLWWKLVNHLASIAREASQLTGNRAPLLWQLLGGELPLTLAYVLPELNFGHEQKAAAAATIAAGLDEMLDADGLPRNQPIGIFPALLASWTRSKALADQLCEGLWPETAAQRYELALVSLARLGTIDPQLCRACQKFNLEKPVRRLMRLLVDGKSAGDKRVRDKALPSPAMHAEEARLAVLRPTWAAKAPRLTAGYSGRAVQLELQLAGEPVISGEWGLDVSLNGKPRELATDWENVCWYSDKDVDFLEIEAGLGNGLRVQRQILLAREDEVLLLADALLLDETTRIDYRSSLPICNHIDFGRAEETREGVLAGRAARALVLPLGLPEWRSDSRRGNLEAIGSGLFLTQSHEGRAAYAPLLIDLNARRAKKDCTWRQLTVAEWRQPQPHDVAVGYRGQVGDCNWLVYRSLAGDGIRSLLGQQVKAEFLFGRMKPDGDCTRLLEIEPIEE